MNQISRIDEGSSTGSRLRVKEAVGETSGHDRMVRSDRTLARSRHMPTLEITEPELRASLS